MMMTSSESPAAVMPATAREAFEQAVALHGEKRLSEAEALYGHALSLDPGHAEALCCLGVLRLQEGKAEKSAELLRRSIAQDPVSAEAHTHLGAALHELGARAEAEALFVKALSLQPDHAGALCHLGLLRLRQGEAEKSVALLRRAVAQSPHVPEPYMYLGAALQRLGAYDDALACHDTALALDPDHAQALAHRGRTLRALGRAPEAIECYDAALAKAPKDAPTELALATVLEASGRFEEAFVRHRNAASLDPNLAGSLTNALSAYAQRRPAVAQAGMQRVNAYVRSFLTNQGNPRMGTYPGLSAAPFHDPARLPGAVALERNFETIRAEIEGLEGADFQEEAENLKGRGDWDVFLFYERGRKNEENCARCPTIAKLIESHNTVRTQAGLIYVSKLGPNSEVRPHRGPTNMRLRCHLGIKVPNGDCGLKVGGEAKGWQEGKCLVFDDSFEHEAWNHTVDARIVLIVDFWHPDLTPAEIAYLEGLHRFASHQADAVSRYWSANAEARSKARAHYD